MVSKDNFLNADINVKHVVESAHEVSCNQPMSFTPLKRSLLLAMCAIILCYLACDDQHSMSDTCLLKCFLIKKSARVVKGGKASEGGYGSQDLMFRDS